MKVDEGYPKRISEGWPGVTFDRIDATLAVGFDCIYFFYGSEYIRFNPLKGCADDGYPQPVQKRWVGLTFERIDAALYWGGGKAYFFHGDSAYPLRSGQLSCGSGVSEAHHWQLRRGLEVH